MTVDNSARVFDQLEKRLEKLLDRFRQTTEENRRLKGQLSEKESQAARLREELETARKSGQKSEELRAEIARYEEEREKLRERVSRLVQSLEAIDASEG